MKNYLEANKFSKEELVKAIFNGDLKIETEREVLSLATEDRKDELNDLRKIIGDAKGDLVKSEQAAEKIKNENLLIKLGKTILNSL